uniref:Resolvase n=1 Tax=Acidipropionibacterium jensenii TaxID=1749 RepID=I3VZB3_9ACTN|nr:recombinase family protein [Acidipropionibacterium jensenii]AFK88690.1 resolvase [Acidipropionibacterium jensenii]
MSITGYARVSTAEQHEAAQIDALKAAGADPIYIDKASGATMARPQWRACLAGLGPGDTLMVTRIDRLGRSLADLVATLDALGRRGVGFRSLAEQLDTTSPGGLALFQMAGVFAEFDRQLIAARTRDGLAAARARGHRPGRPAALTAEQQASARDMRAAGASLGSIARILGVSTRTITRVTT